jgi:hypothetical protein
MVIHHGTGPQARAFELLPLCMPEARLRFLPVLALFGFLSVLVIFTVGLSGDVRQN